MAPSQKSLIKTRKVQLEAAQAEGLPVPDEAKAKRTPTSAKELKSRAIKERVALLTTARSQLRAAGKALPNETVATRLERQRIKSGGLPGRFRAVSAAARARARIDGLFCAQNALQSRLTTAASWYGPGKDKAGIVKERVMSPRMKPEAKQVALAYVLRHVSEDLVALQKLVIAGKVRNVGAWHIDLHRSEKSSPVILARPSA